MEAEQRQNLLEFILSVEAYDQDVAIGKCEPSALDSAMLIYDRFISMQATEPLNFDQSIRIEVEANICTESGVPTLKPFERAKQGSSAILETVNNPQSM
jgi:A-kinase anchor protein 10